MSNEKNFSSTPVNTNSSFKEFEDKRYKNFKKSPRYMFNPCQREAKPLEVGYEHTKEILGL